MTDSLSFLLQWLIPSGGLGAVVVWLTNKKLRNVRTAKEVHETYKVMYENVHQTLIEIQHENKRLYTLLSRLEKAVGKSVSCRYYDMCPIRFELQKHKGDTKETNAGFTPLQRKTDRKARDNPTESGETDDPPG